MGTEQELIDLIKQTKDKGEANEKAIQNLQKQSVADKKAPSYSYSKAKEETKLRKLVTIGFVIVLSVAIVTTIIGSFVYNWHIMSQKSDIKPIDLSSIISFIIGQLFGIFGTIITYYFSDKN